jgi:type I restriction enzyme S subunit
VTKLPPGWHEVELGSLGFEVKGNETLEAGRRHELYSVPAYDLGQPEHVDGSEVKSGKRPVRPGDILICKINPRINRVWIVAKPRDSESQFASTEYLVLRMPNDEPDLKRRFVMWYLRSPQFRNWIKLNVEGATGSHTRAKSPNVLRQRVPLAPPDEQQRIVEVIEEQFSRLDAGVESLHRAKRNLKRLRAAAVQSTFDASWPMVPLGEVTKVSGGIQKQPKRRARANAFPYLRVANVLRGELDLTEVHEMELFAGELDRYRLELGDLLIVEGNGSASQIGRSARWNGAIENCVHQNHIIRARPSGALDSRFLDIYWNSPSLVRRVRQVAASTSGLYTLSTSKVKAVPVPVPSLIEQARVVADVERQLSIIDSMAVTIDAGLAKADAIRNAILTRAFDGTITNGIHDTG